MRIAGRVKTVLYLLLCFLLVSLGIIWWSFFTTSGSNVSLGVLQNRMHNLEYTYRSGNLASGIMLDDLEWQLKNKTRLLAKEIELYWDPSCWRGKSLCLSTVKANTLRIVLPDGSSHENPITLASLNLPFSIEAKQLSIEELVIESNEKSPVFLNNIHFSGSLHASRLTADKLFFDWQTFHVNLNGQMNFHNNYPVKVVARFDSIDQTKSLPIKSQWHFSGDLLKLDLSGGFSKPYTATASGTYSLLDRNLPANIALKWDQATWPIDSADPIAAFADGDLLIHGDWPDYRLDGDMRITGNNIPVTNAELSGSLNTNRISMTPLKLNTIGGYLDVTGVLKWRDGISWHSELDANDLWPNLYWPFFKGFVDGTARFNGRSQNGQTQFDLTEINATGSYAGQQISLGGNTSLYTDGSWQLDNMEAASEENTITANGSIGAESNLKLDFSLNSPEDFLHDIVGDLHGTLQIDGNINSPDISGSASSSSLVYLDTSLRNTTVTGVLRSLGEDESDIRIQMERVHIGDRIISNTDASVNGSLSDHLIRLSTETAPLYLESMHTIGSFDEHRNWSGKIDNFSGKLADYPFSLKDSVTATWISEQQTFAFQPHCWSIEFSSLCVIESALVGRNGSINFKLDELNLAAVDALTPEHIGIDGTLNSKGQVTWQPTKAPSIAVQSLLSDARISITDEKTAETLRLQIETAALDITTRRNTVTARLNMTERNIGKIASKASIYTRNNLYPVSGTLSLEDGKLQWLQQYFPQLTELSGKVSADGKIGGLLLKPHFKGLVNVKDASVQSPQLPMDLSNIDLSIAIDKNQATMTGDAASGDALVAIGGRGELTESGWQSDLQLKADNLAIEHDIVKNARVSTDLTLMMNPNGINVGGSINVKRANIIVTKLGSGGIPVSSDVVIVDAKAAQKPRNIKGKRQIRTTIDVILGRHVHFNGYGLDADLLGDFRITLNAQRPPELRGDIRVIDGNYRSYGQDLVIRDGRISFVGPLEQAVLNVEAVREVDNIMAGLRINGSLGYPKASLFSEPAMPEEEILSYIVLGRQLDFGNEDETMDDSQLLANAALFMGIRNGQSLSRNIASTFGIDDFTLSSRGSGDETQVVVSGRLNNRLLVRYGLGVFNSISTLFVRYDLAEKLYLETTQGFAEGLEKAVDLYYSFDF
ncbi:hypothetical protein AB833_30645 [Chromatiales bacterium (ex Bugula neritina AB1)]|nr:hypothetical protein AB833_30645 [Chromatiales bacterium (ex Bugula neritina AB1)]